MLVRWLFLGSILFAASNAAAAAARPNLVLFIADDLGGLDTAPYGATEVRTPTIERLARGGMKFSHAYVASPACAPSRAALLTGLMPARNGAEPNHSRPRAVIKKLPAYLQELGYEVAAFGKVAHYNHGPFYGFDHVAGEGFHKHEGIGLAVEFLKTRKADKPLCLMVGTNWPHMPWPDETDYQAGQTRLPPTHVDTPETRAWRARYYAAVTKADDDLGTILAAVRERLDPANTYTFFTSDHGAQWPFGKWNLYDAGIRVPLLASGPGIKPGTTSDALVSWIDILPTLVDLAGGKPPEGIDGRSFASVLRGEQTTHREEIYTTHSGDREFNVYPIRALTDGRWKYIRNLHPDFQYATHINRAIDRSGRPYFASWEEAAKRDAAAAAIVRRYKERPAEELYDLAADPHEQHNLAANPQQAERLAAMRAKVTAWMKSQGDAGTVFDKPLLLGEEATPIVTGAAKGKKKAAK